MTRQELRARGGRLFLGVHYLVLGAPADDAPLSRHEIWLYAAARLMADQRNLDSTTVLLVTQQIWQRWLLPHRPPQPRIFFIDRRFVTWEGAPGVFDLADGGWAKRPATPPLESLAYDLTVAAERLFQEPADAA